MATLPFFDLDLFGPILAKFKKKHTTFDEIPKKCDIFWQIFFENFAFIWPFFTFENLNFF